jgi:predicted dehydrogenase
LADRAVSRGSLRTVGDIGVHWLDLAEHVSGLRIEAVCADLARFLDRRGDRTVETEDAAYVLLRFEGGADGRRAVAVADAIGRSAREERWVQIAD